MAIFGKKGVARAGGALTAILVAACSNATGSSAGAVAGAATGMGTAQANWSSVRKVEVTDPQYQMTAFTVGVPSDWKFAGEVVRPPGCHGNGPALKSTSVSPDGKLVIAHLPGYSWSWPLTSSNGPRQGPEAVRCTDSDIVSAADFLKKVAVPNMRPQATIVATTPLGPEGQAAVAQQLEQMQQTSVALADRFHQPHPKIILEGARVRLRYTANGKPVEEMLQTIITCREISTPAMGPLPASSNRFCAARNLLVIRAPQGQLDEWIDSPALLALNKITQQNPNWAQRLQQDMEAAAQNAARRNDEQFRANSQANQDSFNAMLASNKAQTAARTERGQQAMAQDAANQAAIDDAAHRTALYSLGRQDFINPSTGQRVEADANYNHQYMSSDGSALIQTDDHTFDPNKQVSTVISQTWTELVPR